MEAPPCRKKIKKKNTRLANYKWTSKRYVSNHITKSKAEHKQTNGKQPLKCQK